MICFVTLIFPQNGQSGNLAMAAAAAAAAALKQVFKTTDFNILMTI